MRPECDSDDLLSYRHLDGDWALFYKIARLFVHKVKKEDRADFLHDLLLEMAKVKAKYEARGRPLTEAGLMLVARYRVASYWHVLIRHRPTILSLNRAHDFDHDGKATEILALLADDNAVDIIDRLEARRILRALPRKLVRIAYRKYSGYPLTRMETAYLLASQELVRQVIRQLEAHGTVTRAMENTIRLDGKPLSATQAARETGIPYGTISKWVSRGQVKAVNRPRHGGWGNPVLLDPVSLQEMIDRYIPQRRNNPERIRQAYFLEGKSIKQIAREFQHTRRTVQKAIYMEVKPMMTEKPPTLKSDVRHRHQPEPPSSSTSTSE